MWRPDRRRSRTPCCRTEPASRGRSRQRGLLATGPPPPVGVTVVPATRQGGTSSLGSRCRPWSDRSLRVSPGRTIGPVMGQPPLRCMHRDTRDRRSGGRTAGIRGGLPLAVGGRFTVALTPSLPAGLTWGYGGIDRTPVRIAPCCLPPSAHLLSGVEGVCGGVQHRPGPVGDAGADVVGAGAG